MEYFAEFTYRAFVVGLVCALVIVLGMLGSQARPDFRGWRQIKAGPMHWTALVLGAVLTCFMAFIWLFVGSTRADAAQQMTILFGLICAFGLGTVGAGIQALLINRRALRWRAGIIRFASASGAESRNFTDISDIRQRPWGNVVVEFADGGSVKVDPYAQGASQLIDAVASELGSRQPS